MSGMTWSLRMLRLAELASSSPQSWRSPPLGPLHLPCTFLAMLASTCNACNGTEHQAGTHMKPQFRGVWGGVDSGVAGQSWLSGISCKSIALKNPGRQIQWNTVHRNCSWNIVTRASISSSSFKQQTLHKALNLNCKVKKDISDQTHLTSGFPEYCLESTDMSASGKFHQDPASRAFIQDVPFPRKLMINVHYPGMVPTKYLSACHIWGHNFWASESGQYRPIGRERLKGIRKSSLSQGSSSRCKLPAASFWDKEHSASPASSADGHWADAARDSATQVSFTEWLKCRDWLMSESLSSEGSGETWEIWKRLNEIERATERATQSEHLRTQPCQSELQTGFTLGTCFFFLCFLPFLAWTGARKAGQWRGQICAKYLINVWVCLSSSWTLFWQHHRRWTGQASCCRKCHLSDLLHGWIVNTSSVLKCWQSLAVRYSPLQFITVIADHVTLWVLSSSSMSRVSWHTSTEFEMVWAGLGHFGQLHQHKRLIQHDSTLFNMIRKDSTLEFLSKAPSVDTILPAASWTKGGCSLSAQPSTSTKDRNNAYLLVAGNDWLTWAKSDGKASWFSRQQDHSTKSVCASNLRVGGAGAAPAGLYAMHKISSKWVYMCIRCISISIYFSVCLSVYLPSWWFVRPSACLSVSLPLCLSLSLIYLLSSTMYIYIYVLLHIYIYVLLLYIYILLYIYVCIITYIRIIVYIYMCFIIYI